MPKHAMPRRHTLSHPLLAALVTLLALVAIVVAGVAGERLYKARHGARLAATPVATISKPAHFAHGTSYVKVMVDGYPRLVFGTKLTTVKKVLTQAHITLEPGDSVSPGLFRPVTEKTVIHVDKAGTAVETVDSPIPYNTIMKKDPSLPKGEKKVQSKGKKGVMEATNLVRKAGTKVESSNALASYVKRPPANKVVLVGTAVPQATVRLQPQVQQKQPAGQAQDQDMGTTMPVGDAQTYAHEQVKKRGWSEDEFTCLVELWQRESGWRTDAANPSGAYGIPQALPGSKMGAGWQTDAKVQINWGLGYIAGRYQTPCGAWQHSNSTGWY